MKLTKYGPQKKIIEKPDQNAKPPQNLVPVLPSQKQVRHVFASVEENFSFLEELLGKAIGLVQQRYSLGDCQTGMGVAYIDGMTNKEFISEQVIESLLRMDFDPNMKSADMLALIMEKFIYIPDTITSEEMQQAITGLLRGNTVLFVNGVNAAIIINSQKMEKRSIEKPENEPTLFASRDAFTEDIETNSSLIIRRLPTPDLRFESFSVGKISQTMVKLLWLEGIANMKAVGEARQRLQKIDIDVVEGIGDLSALIEDQEVSAFPKYKQTERPDITAKYLSNGHFVLLCSNNPWAFVAPVSFWDNFKTIDDYNEKTLVAIYLRIIRILAFIISILISPLYLTFVTYNQQVVPPALALNISSGRQGVPFPSVVEILLLTVVIGIIREAALRIPSTVGFFVGILGAVIIGQAAVTAGYVSASVIIVVAVSAITSFAVSTNVLVLPSRLINYFLIALAGILGMFGLINGVALVFWHLINLKSFGMPYMYPLVPFDREMMKDTVIRAPLSFLQLRPGILVKDNRRRMSEQGINIKNIKQEDE
jgi:Bacillus/Clostridium GerA spore germination protein.